MNTIITGATKGIGRAIAEKFAEEGHHLAVCARNDIDLKAMQKDFAKRFPQCQLHILPTDVSNKQEVNEFADFVQKQFSQIDVLINNAGWFQAMPLIEEKVEEEGLLEKMIQTNLMGAYHLTRKLLPSMIQQKSGHLFNICSTASFKIFPDCGSYIVSKFALLGLTKVLREELKPHQIKVTAVMPGATESFSWEGVEIEKGRILQPKQVAQSIFDVYQLSGNTVIEELVIRPQLGDL